jgi:hypothetical protein
MIQLYFFQILSAYVDTVKFWQREEKLNGLTMNRVHDLQTSVWILVPEAIKNEFHVTYETNH